MKQTPTHLLNHAVVQTQYDAFSDGTLPAAETAAYEAHWRACEVCQEWVARQTSIVRELRADMPPPHQLSPAGAVQIQQAMYKQIKRSILMQNVKLSLRAITAVAVLVLVVGSVLWWQFARDNQAASPTDPTVPEATTAVEGAVDAGIDQPVSLTFAAPGAQRSRYEVVAALFNRLNPDISVQVIGLSPNSDPATQADTAVLDLPPTAVTSYVALNDQITTDINPGDYFANALQGCQKNDIAYGLPLSLSPSYLYYDVVVWHNAGVAPPAATWTWPELVQTITALSSGDGTRYGFGSVAGLLRLLAPLLAANLDENGALNPAELEPYLQDIANLVAAGHVADVDEAELEELILNGRVGLWLDNPATLSPRVAELGDVLGKLLAPTIGNLTATHPAAAGCVVISRGSAQPEAAWRWLQYLVVNPPQLPQDRIPANRLVFAEMQSNALPREAATMQALEHLWFNNQRSQIDGLLLALQQHVVNGLPLAEALAQTAFAAETPPDAEASVPIISPPEPEAGPTVINFYGDEFQLNEAVSAFEQANPDVVVNISFGNRVGTFSMNDIAEQFDCFVWSAVPNPAANISEVVWDLSDLVSPETLSDYPPEILALSQEDGALWGLPLEVNPLVIRYNENRFSERGVPLPTPDWTLNDMLTTAAQFGQPGDAPNYGFISIGFGPLSGPDIVELLLLEQGISLWDVTAGTVHVTDPAVAAVFSQYVGWLQQNALFASALGEGMDERNTLVQGGNSALWATPSDRRPIAIGVPEPFAVLPLPYLTSQNLPTPWQSVLFISKQVEDPSGCRQWFEFLTTRADAITAVPARQSLATSRAWENEVGPENAAVFRESLARHLAASSPEVNQTIFSVKQPLYHWLQDAAEAVAAGSDLAAELANLQTQSATYLACVGQDVSASYEEISVCAQQVDPDYGSQ